MATTITDADMTVTITPTATTSKILYMFNCSAHVMNAVQTFVRVLRDSTQIAYAERWSGYSAVDNWTPYPVVVQGVDSPSTTSATTYKIQIQRETGSADVRISSNSQASSLMAMEVLA